jgi:hypothetical protein
MVRTGTSPMTFSSRNSGERVWPVKNATRRGVPVGTAEFEHQRHLVGVAAFQKAIKREFGSLAHRLLAISSFMISLVPP